jgi:hypothetical protein
MPCATTLRAVPSTTSDAVFGHNPHAPFGLRRRGGISGVAAPPRYARYRVVAPPWICPHGARNANRNGPSATC